MKKFIKSGCRYYNECYCNKSENYNPNPRIYYNDPSTNLFSYIVWGTLDKNCDGEENIVYDRWYPDVITVKVTNRGDCPVQIWIYYSDGFSMKRLGKKIETGETHEFDKILTVFRVSITCEQIECTTCNMNNNTNNHCLVDYLLS